MFRVLQLVGGLVIGLSAFITHANATDVYLFRGAGDFSFVQKSLQFSKGIDKMARELNAAGIYARSTRWENTAAMFREISRRRPASVAFIGHSMGAMAALAMAKIMKKIGVRVAYVGLIDIPGPIGAVSSNVELAENYYHAFPVYGRLTGSRGNKGIVTNHYVFGQVHITMDDSSQIQNAMISAIWQADDRDRAVRLAGRKMPLNERGEALDTSLTASIGQFGRRVMHGFEKLKSH